MKNFLLSSKIKDAVFFLCAISFYLLLNSCAVFAQTPEITKVEPPDWWANHTINPVRVLGCVDITI